MNVYKHFLSCIVKFVFFGLLCEGRRVKRNGWFGPKPPNASCLFDLCNSGYCQNNGSCTMNQETCLSNCQCPESYTGLRCEVSMLPPGGQESSSLSPTTRSIEDRTCFEGFICEHGDCNMASGRFGCICDPHWEGTYCDKFKCDLDCPRGSRCEAKNNAPVCVEVTTTAEPTTMSKSCPLRPLKDTMCHPNFICVNGICDKVSTSGFRCICDPFWGGVFCDQSFCPSECPCGCSQVNKTYVCNPSGVLATTTAVPTTEKIKQNACNSNYTVRPLLERKCRGMTCKYGYCVQETVEIHGIKTYKYHCECDNYSEGFECQNKCCLDCGENGRCEIDSDNVPFCNCNSNKIHGPYCNLTRSDPGPEYLRETWYMWVVGVCAFVLVVLLLTMVVLPYMMWRHRVTLIMKIVHYFQPYEDNDERKWDAFVAFRSGGADEDFVLNKLKPKLEDEMGFSLCLHFRDFTPGETIANNIIESVNDSRRTLLIVTPRFVESEFLQFEYQIAQEQMLKRKQRIIPIILKDISSIQDSIDPNLKLILKSVTYIGWPEESNEKKEKVFWQRLELSMPKRKSVEEKQKAHKMRNVHTSRNFIVNNKTSGLHKKEPSSVKSTDSQIKIISHDNIAFEIENSKKIPDTDLNVNIESYMMMMGNSKC